MLYYLTGRHVDGMHLGTAKSLVDHGFPLYRGRTVLHLKPSFHMKDHDFKEMALADIRSLAGPVVATFENEPGNANLFLASFPDAAHFLVSEVHSPSAPPPSPLLVKLADFSR